MIYLSIPNYPDPQGPTPITAFGKINTLSADFLTGQGAVVLGIYRTVAALEADSQPLDTITILAGGRVVRGRGNRPDRPTQPPVVNTGPTFPGIVQMVTDNAAAWMAIWTYLLTQAATLDALKGATLVTV